ncbi:MAG: hypothetical protein U5L75_00140 [Candidatus Campbellbacteria bacterium]|nr:hypothetical protein [Candidatus Campbellbacteria bacterium]
MSIEGELFTLCGRDTEEVRDLVEDLRSKDLNICFWKEDRSEPILYHQGWQEPIIGHSRICNKFGV